MKIDPSYSGGRDQKDCSLKPAWANSSMRSYLKKNPSQKRAGGVAQGKGPEFKTQYQKKKKKWRQRRQTFLLLLVNLWTQIRSQCFLEKAACYTQTNDRW
jgi:hypothetical protein